MPSRKTANKGYGIPFQPHKQHPSNKDLLYLMQEAHKVSKNQKPEPVIGRCSAKKLFLRILQKFTGK